MSNEAPRNAGNEATRVSDALCELVDSRVSAKQSSVVKEAVDAASTAYREQMVALKDEVLAAIKQMQDEQRAALASLKNQHAAAVADMTERWEAQEIALLTEVQLLRDELKVRHCNGLEKVNGKKKQDSPKPRSSLQNTRRSMKLRSPVRSRGRNRSPSRRRGSCSSRSRSWGSSPRNLPRNYVYPTYSSSRHFSESAASPNHDLARDPTYRH
ncbi:unnamed protein product [Phytophthora fragariaefolia]|uniref:Unnamed protein product n=1 Tax=Phytophthora fragariaefolia TaxID=1490495 RepID=A0A9W6Y4G8_9STRA|nr:unnamed protein product [Phytophthora fragariaefolia]